MNSSPPPQPANSISNYCTNILAILAILAILGKSRFRAISLHKIHVGCKIEDDIYVRRSAEHQTQHH